MRARFSPGQVLRHRRRPACADAGAACGARPLHGKHRLRCRCCWIRIRLTALGAHLTPEGRWPQVAAPREHGAGRLCPVPRGHAELLPPVGQHLVHLAGTSARRRMKSNPRESAAARPGQRACCPRAFRNGAASSRSRACRRPACRGPTRRRCAALNTSSIASCSAGNGCWRWRLALGSSHRARRPTARRPAGSWAPRACPRPHGGRCPAARPSQTAGRRAPPPRPATGRCRAPGPAP
jgi:hypothetical protein